MTPERWRQVEEIFHAALLRRESERVAFLVHACASDLALRREVEALLAQQASGFLEGPAVASAASTVSDAGDSLLTGRRLGAYQVHARIGVGGMGEVYRARDMKLGRDVAIKILPRHFTTDPNRLARFEREARVLASLNHPHIGAIYGLEDADGVRALVLELVNGETLADRIARGRIPLKETLIIARQMADALDAAHEKGIIHRDLKPANIKITPDGVVKVLDFGLARIVRPSDSSASDSERPTITIEETREGLVMGTAAYMSPEQARGQTVDKRTDVWAFGCVLYEMLTGRVVFHGETISDTIAAILEREPDWKRLPAQTPATIRRLLERCLDKDAKRRVRDIGDVAVEVNDSITSPAKVREPRKVVPRWVWGMASGIAALGLALGWTIARIGQPLVETRAVRLTVNPPAGTEFGVDTGAVMSPDGRMLAFVTGSSGGTKLWVRPLDSLSARELPGTDAATFPFWSTDGRSLGFFAAGKLKRIEVAGGLPTVICDVGTGRGGTWNEEGVILFNSVNDGPLLRVSENGGTPVPFTTVDKAQGENSHRWPHFLPGGRRFLYFVRTAGADSGTYLGSLDRPQEKLRLLGSPTNAVYTPHRGKPFGQLLWVRDGTLMAQPFDPEQGRTLGEPVTVAEGVAFGSASRLAAVSASNDGTLLYGAPGIRHFQFTWYDREGKKVGAVGQPVEHAGLRISPDGKRVALTRSGDVWQMEFARGIPTRVTFGGGFDPVWSPDSQRIAYWKGYPPNLFSRSMNGTGTEQRLSESHDTLRTQDWSPDGRLLLYLVNSNDLSSKTRLDLWVLPMTGDGKPVPFLSTPFQEGRGQFSPDGKWVAYTSDESGGTEVYVQSFPAGGSKSRVSSKGGDWVRWRRDGREMFYIAPDRKAMSVTVQAIADSLEFGTPRALFTIPFALSTSGDIAPYTYDVMPDGQRFLALAPAGDAESPPITVILNWQAELSTAKK
jgi:eukaryotic-like serine/threonine-protein kinase